MDNETKAFMEVIKDEPNENKRITGKIIKIDLEKGFGFISSQDIKFRRIFFHWSSLVQDTKTFEQLTTGMKVEFIAQFKEPKGYRAIQIKVIE